LLETKELTNRNTTFIKHKKFIYLSKPGFKGSLYCKNNNINILGNNSILNHKNILNTIDPVTYRQRCTCETTGNYQDYF